MSSEKPRRGGGRVATVIVSLVLAFCLLAFVAVERAPFDTMTPLKGSKSTRSLEETTSNAPYSFASTYSSIRGTNTEVKEGRKLIFDFLCQLINLFDIFDIIPDCTSDDPDDTSPPTSAPTLAPGERCNDDSECTSNACGRSERTLILPPNRCCEIGATTVASGFNDYCTERPNGTNCGVTGRLDEMCASGKCGRNPGIPYQCCSSTVQVGLLIPVTYCRVGSGVDCAVDEQCSSGTCGADGKCV